MTAPQTAFWISIAFLLAGGAVSAAEFVPYVSAQPTDRPVSRVGVQLRTQPVELGGHVTAEKHGSRTVVVPRLFSKIGVGSKMSMEARLDFAEWNSRPGLFDESALELRFRAAAPLPLIRQIESSVFRGAAGDIRQRLSLDFVENLGMATENTGSTKLDMNLSVLQTGRDGSIDDSVFTFRATVTGFAEAAGAVQNKLSFRYESRPGSKDNLMGVLAYDGSWQVNDVLRVNFAWELIDAREPERKLTFGWAAGF